MAEVLAAYPGAQRAIFRKYHIGGCSSCGFQQEEMLEQVCDRNNHLLVSEVLAHIQSSHEQDKQILIEAKDLAALLQRQPGVKLLDIRSREEFEAARIEGAIFFTQELMHEAMGRWPKDELFILVDHQGKKALDAAAYFLGHGLTHVRALRGGLDAWSQEVDDKIPRYRLA